MLGQKNMLSTDSIDCCNNLLSLNYSSATEIRDELKKEFVSIKCFYMFKDFFILTGEDKYDVYPDKWGVYPNGYNPFNRLSWADLGPFKKHTLTDIGLTKAFTAKVFSVEKAFNLKEDKIYSSNTCKRWLESL
jgi:hypothetical protein